MVITRCSERMSKSLMNSWMRRFNGLAQFRGCNIRELFMGWEKSSICSTLYGKCSNDSLHRQPFKSYFHWNLRVARSTGSRAASFSFDRGTRRLKGTDVKQLAYCASSVRQSSPSANSIYNKQRPLGGYFFNFEKIQF